MNDDAVCLAHRVPLWEPSLLAMNDDAVCLTYRGACIAGKRAPTGLCYISLGYHRMYFFD